MVVITPKKKKKHNNPLFSCMGLVSSPSRAWTRVGLLVSQPWWFESIGAYLSFHGDSTPFDALKK